MPRVSVLLSSLNHAKFVAEAIQSVLDQTFTDFELIIIDDCSDDDSWNVIQRFRDPRIRTFRNAERRRGAAGFNDAIRSLAQGEYVAIHHSDDAWLPEKLEKQVAFLSVHHEVGAVFSQVTLFGEDGNPITDSSHFYHSVFQQPNRNRLEWLRYFFLEGNCLCHPSVLARRQALLDAGLYDRRLGQITDFDLWVRLCLHHEIHILNDALVRFRIRNGEANQSGNKQETYVRGRNEWPLALGRLLRICDEEEFFSIFPEMRSRSHPAGNNLPFLLALRAIETGSDYKMLFGLNLLYTLLEDEPSAARIREKYGFGYTDLIALSAQVDPFRSNDVFSMRQHIHLLVNEIARIKNTVSWRITAPLRVVWNSLRKLSGKTPNN